MGTSKFNADPVMDWHPIKGGAETPSRFMLQKQVPDLWAPNHRIFNLTNLYITESLVKQTIFFVLIIVKYCVHGKKHATLF